MTRGWDGRWSALDGRQLYLQAKTAGTLYQAALRHELRALGLRFVLRDNGLCELADVPRRVLRAFSRRRVEIEAELARRGLSSREAAEVTALATRKAKDYGVSAGSLSTEWHARAEAMGFDRDARCACKVAPAPCRPAVRSSRAPEPSCSVRQVLRRRPPCSTAATRCAPGADNCPAVPRWSRSSGWPTSS